jgi:hypothetical protein
VVAETGAHTATSVEAGASEGDPKGDMGGSEGGNARWFFSHGGTASTADFFGGVI